MHDDLVRHGYLWEEVEETPSGYTKYVYTLTDKGKRLLKDAENKKLLSLNACMAFLAK